MIDIQTRKSKAFGSSFSSCASFWWNKVIGVPWENRRPRWARSMVVVLRGKVEMDVYQREGCGAEMSFEATSDSVSDREEAFNVIC